MACFLLKIAEVHLFSRLRPPASVIYSHFQPLASHIHFARLAIIVLVVYEPNRQTMNPMKYTYTKISDNSYGFGALGMHWGQFLLHYSDCIIPTSGISYLGIRNLFQCSDFIINAIIIFVQGKRALQPSLRDRGSANLLSHFFLFLPARPSSFPHHLRSQAYGCVYFS